MEKFKAGDKAMLKIADIGEDKVDINEYNGELYVCDYQILKSFLLSEVKRRKDLKLIKLK